VLIHEEYQRALKSIQKSTGITQNHCPTFGYHTVPKKGLERVLYPFLREEGIVKINLPAPKRALHLSIVVALMGSLLSFVANPANATATNPGYPTNVIATRTGSTTADVAFTAPANNGGTPITSYTATSSPGGLTGTLTQAGSGVIAFTGLTPGVSYSFTMYATNAVGNSVGNEYLGYSNSTRLGVLYNGSGSGDVACGTTGYFIVLENSVAGNWNCTGSVSIPHGVTTIGTAFDADPGYNGLGYYNSYGSTIATNVTSLTISNTVTSIADFAFRYLSAVELQIPNSVTSIGNYSFFSASQLETLTVGSGLIRVSDASFAGAISLTSLTLGNGVRSIGSHAFSSPRKLTAITFGTGLTTIEANAFRGASKLQAIDIPDSVISIGVEAFAMDEANELNSIIFGNNIVSIGADAFSGVTNVTELDIPGSVTSIGNNAFHSFTSLETLTIASSVLALGSNSFFNASSLSTLNYCGELTQSDFTTAGIGSLYTSKICSVSAPSAPSSITATLVDTQTVTVSFSAPTSNGGAPISAYLVTSSPGAITKKVNQELGGSVTVTGLSSGTTYTFTVIASNWGKSSLPSTSSNAVTTPNLPGSPTIGTSTLTNPTTASVTFSAPSNNGGSTITRYTAVSSPDGRTGTVNQAGSGSISVTGLSPGAAYTFTVIATNAVGDSVPSSESNSLTTPTVPDPPTTVVATKTSSTSVNITFAAPANNGGETITSYTARSYSYTDDSLGETGTVAQPGNRSINITGLSETATYTFWVFATNSAGNSQDSDYSNVIIGSPYDPSTGNGEIACVNDGPRLGAGFFTISNNKVVKSDGCQGSAVIPNGVLEIDNEAFYGSNITSVVIPTGVTTIGDFAFRGSDLTSLVIPNSVTTLGSQAFRDLENLTSLTIGSGVTSISPRAFQDALSLTSIVIPNSVITIGQSAFANAESLMSLTLGNSVDTIGQSAFAGAYNLSSLTLPGSVRTIGLGAFQYTSSLGSLVIPNGVTDIGDFAFYGASSITSVTIPDSAVNIGEEAFSGTTALLTANYCGTTPLDAVYIGLSNSVNITCARTPVITVGTTDFQPLVATNVGITLSGFDETLNYQATVKFVNVATNGDVSNGILTATRGGTSTIPGYTSYSSTKLGFKGSYAQVASALASLTWNPATGSGNISMRIGMASMPGTSEFYFDANSGHYYKYVSTPLTWVNARTAAEATTLFGLRGYLAEVNTAAENFFIGRETTATNVWIGASDRTTEGTWTWDGATNTYAKPTGSGSNSGRTATFHSWANGEPNDWPWHGPSKPEREDCAVTNWQGKLGMWNDWPCLVTQPYLIEFGGRPGETSSSVGATLTRTVNALPPVQYTITYDRAGGDTTPTSPSRITGDKFALAGAITRADSGDGIIYQFAGWKTGTTIYKAGETFTVGSANLTFTAQWVLRYEVTYQTNGGSFASGDTERDTDCSLVSSRRVCSNGQSITLNSAPTKARHNFAGWQDSSGNLVADTTPSTAGIQTTVTDSRYIFTATWTPITYTVTYVSSGSSVPTQGALEEGETFAVGRAGTRTGFRFDGWSDGVSTFLPESVFMVETSTITLTAEWTPVFTVAYSAGLGSGTPSTDSASYPNGYSLAVATDAGISRSGFTFSGWSDGTTTYQVGDIYTIGTSNITLTAEWSAAPVTPAPAPAPAPAATPKPVDTVTAQKVIAAALKVARENLQISVAKNQKTYLEVFASASTSNSSNSTIVKDTNSGALINTKSESINSSQSAKLKVVARNISLASDVIEEFKSRVQITVITNGISVTPVKGFTGVLIIPFAATVDGIEAVVLNKVVVNPAPPIAQNFAPTSINKSSISWAPSTSQTTGYLVKINGKEICQTTATTCPVAQLIGPKSVVTIAALGNDKTVSSPVVIPYVATRPIPALKVNFALGSSILSTAQKNEIRSVARVIDTQGFTRLVVSGFTDSSGSSGLNKKLSEARARSVAAFMRTLLPKIAIKASAFGPNRPVASNGSKSGQAQNRRTEIATW
jgi:uncharacterized repeat protein (TIGR02543 family)